MASNVSKTQLLRTLNKRHFASTAPKLACEKEFKVTTLPNNITVASLDWRLPISRILVTFKAGSRYEPADLPGLSHVLRSSAGLSTFDSTKFGIIRNIQQIGGNLSCTGGRDTITYTLEATYDKLEQGFKFLKDVASNQAFKPWELEDNVEHIKNELSVLPPEAKLVDLLHKAAYRNGLGNSLYVDEFNIGKITSESLQYFVQSAFTSSGTAVVGVGVDHETVNCFASSLELPTGPSPPNTCVVYSGDTLSVQGPAPLAYVGVAAESAGWTDNDVYTFNVLRYALGGWSSIKWSHGNSPLAQIVKNSKGPSAISAFNAVHADSGLFGFVLATPQNLAKASTVEAIKVLKNLLLTDSAVAAAKKQLYREILEQNGEEVGSSFSTNLLLAGSSANSLDTLDAVIAAIECVTVSAAAQALDQFLAGKKTVVSYGKLGEVPYAEDLA